MMNNVQSRILSVFGSLIIICGIISIYSTGIKGLNLLLGTLVVGIAAWIVSFALSKNKMNEWVGVGVILAGILIFGQRSIAHLLALIGIVQHELSLNAYDKCITTILLIIMTSASVSALITYFAFLKSNKPNTEYVN